MAGRRTTKMPFLVPLLLLLSCRLPAVVRSLDVEPAVDHVGQVVRKLDEAARDAISRVLVRKQAHEFMKYIQNHPPGEEWRKWREYEWFTRTEVDGEPRVHFQFDSEPAVGERVVASPAGDDHSAFVRTKRKPSLKEVLVVLQGVLGFENMEDYLKKGTKTTLNFEIPLFGQEFSFRLRKAPRGKDHIFYERQTERGIVGPHYEPQGFLNILDEIGPRTNTPQEKGERQKQLATYLLESLDTPVDKLTIAEVPEWLQPNAEEGYTADHVVIDKQAIVDFLLITATAEGALPDQEQISRLAEEGPNAYNAEATGHKSGRIMGAHVWMRSLLQGIKDGHFDEGTTGGSFLEVFSDNANWPLRESPQTARETWGRPFEPAELTEAKRGLNKKEDHPVSEPDEKTGDRVYKRTREEAHLTHSYNLRSTKIRANADADEKTVKGVVDSLLDGVCSQSHDRSRRKRSAFVCGESGEDDPLRLQLDEESLEVKEGRLEFEVYETGSPERRHKLNVAFDEKTLASVRYATEQDGRAGKPASEAEPGSTVRKLGTAMSVHGTIFNVLGAINYFKRGDTIRGVVTTSQALHGVGGMVGLNDLAAKVTRRVLDKAVLKSAENLGLEGALNGLREGAAGFAEKKVGKRTVGKFMEDVPLVGIGFDMYFIGEDIADLTHVNTSDHQQLVMLPLEIYHLVLDVETTVLSLLGPEFEPAVLALSLVRMSVDSFYIDIATEIQTLTNRDFAHVAVAALKGIGEGATDFLTGGMLQSMKQLKASETYGKEMLADLTRPETYYRIDGTDCAGNTGGTIDFTAGDDSTFGGMLTLTLYDNDTFSVQLAAVADQYGLKHTYTAVHACAGLTDIVLGIGESATPVMTRKAAKLWGFIPVKHYELLSRFDADEHSHYGQYRGNSDANNFFAVQRQHQQPGSVVADEQTATPVEPSSCDSLAAFQRHAEINFVEDNTTQQLNERLRSYHYRMYGEGGDDSFYVGPQRSHVQGGDGRDFYIVPKDGGHVVLDNFSADKHTDTLVLNVSHTQIVCARRHHHLLVSSCSGTHTTVVKDWYRHAVGGASAFRHLNILAADGVQLEPFDHLSIDALHARHPSQSVYSVACRPVALDYRHKTSGQTVDLHATEHLACVRSVTGSNHSDFIIGNQLPNTIDGRLGDDVLYGGNGSDTYIVNPTGQMNVINNYALDGARDILLLNTTFDQAILSRNKDDLIVGVNPGVRILRWFSGSEYRHIDVITTDLIHFTAKITKDGGLLKSPTMLDFSNEKNDGVDVNLGTGTVNRSLDQHDSSWLKFVNTVVDTKFDDVVVGNELGNMLSCTGGSDNLSGKNGSDVYTIDLQCANVTINNCANDSKTDVLFLSMCYSDIEVNDRDGVLELRDKKTRRTVSFVDWFRSPNCRHVIVNTLDGVKGRLPESVLELYSRSPRVTLIPLEVSLPINQDCHEQQELVYNLAEKPWTEVLRFTANSTKCAYRVTGNSQDNYIDLGRGQRTRYVEGGNGSDAYLINHDYGWVKLNNYATDHVLDTLHLGVQFSDINIGSVSGDHLVIQSSATNDMLDVTLLNYLSGGVDYQHLIGLSSDGVMFRFTSSYPYKMALTVDHQASKDDWYFNEALEPDYGQARVVYGSSTAENHLNGTDATRRLVGGANNDTIMGGSSGELIEGLLGNDTLFGNNGTDALYGGDGNDILMGGSQNDVLYGGYGADYIDGGPGHDTVVFQGDGTKQTGVEVTLGSVGRGADAEGDTYISVESIYGSEFADQLEGDDQDNYILGFAGDDILTPNGGVDFVSGGNGRDTYNFTLSSGWKIVDNFATDEINDSMVLSPDSVIGNSTNFCCYTLDSSVYMHINKTQSGETVLLDVVVKHYHNDTAFRHLSVHLENMKPLYLEDDCKDVTAGVLAVGGMNLSIISRQATNVLVSLDHSVRQLSGFQIDLVYKAHNTTGLKTAAVFALHTDRPFSLQTGPDVIDISSESKNALFLFNITGLVPGTMHAFAMVVKKCSQLVYITKPVLQRTLPGTVSQVEVRMAIRRMSVSWQEPSEAIGYRYIVKAVPVADQHIREIVLVTDYEETSALLQPLYESHYRITVRALSGVQLGEAAFLEVSTGAVHCVHLSVPAHSFVEERNIQTSHGWIAELNCVAGYVGYFGQTKVARRPKVLCGTKKAPTCVLNAPRNESVSETGGSCPQFSCRPKQCRVNAMELRRLNLLYSVANGRTPVFRCQHPYVRRTTSGLAVVTQGEQATTSACRLGHWQPALETVPCNVKVVFCSPTPKCPPGVNCRVEAAFMNLWSSESSEGRLDEYAQQSQIKYSCPAGHSLEGPAKRTCQKDGHWDWDAVVTRCRPLACDQPPVKHSPQRASHVVGDTVSLLCPTPDIRCYIAKWCYIGGDPLPVVGGPLVTNDVHRKPLLLQRCTEDGDWQPVFNDTERRCHYRRLRACDAQPCRNGGVCSPLPPTDDDDEDEVDFRCDCPVEYGGIQCETYRAPVQTTPSSVIDAVLWWDAFGPPRRPHP